MSTIREWWDGFWRKVHHSPTILPTHIPIPHDRTDKQMGQSFKRDKHYFTVDVNRIFLKYDREFWTIYAPMALVVSEFQYDGQDTIVPFVVGPSMLEKDKIDMPNGFIFKDTRVAGIHPYKGDDFKLTVILYQIKRTDIATKLLKVVENLASVLDFSQTLSSYLKIAGVIVNTVGELIGTDGSTQPLIGIRHGFNAGDGFTPGYYALIDNRGVQFDETKFWIRNNELLYGDKDNAVQFTGANYILYSIGQTSERTDYEKLPFYAQWKTALAEATTANPEKWQSAKANWTTLYQMMTLSPDLIEDQSDALAEDCWNQMETKHNKIKSRFSTMGADETEQKALEVAGKELRSISERLDPVRSKSISVLSSD